MNREEAIEALTRIKWVYVGNELFEAEKEQAIEIAIEALEREPSEDGTLEVKVEDATKIGRVLISDDEHRGGLYYPDEDEPKGDDLISRAEAIEAITGALDAIDHVPKWVFDKLTCAINILPSADRPTDGDLISRAEAIEALGEEPPVWCDEDYEIAERSQWRADIEAIESVPSADRPRGEWLETAQDYYEMVNKKGGGVKENTEYFIDDIACPNCLAKFSNIDNETERFNFCPNCGAEMRERSEDE